jgi:sodium transport system permease protein
LGQKWWAIGLSAVFFGMTHSVIQQSLAAAIIGVALGYIAVQSGSLIPCILFHFVYNGLNVGLSEVSAQLQESVERWPALGWLFQEPAADQAVYPWYVTGACAVAAAGLLVWFHRLPYLATREERISDARARQGHVTLVGGVTNSVE